jgi:hypothetical protein
MTYKLRLGTAAEFYLLQPSFYWLHGESHVDHAGRTPSGAFWLNDIAGFEAGVPLIDGMDLLRDLYRAQAPDRHPKFEIRDVGLPAKVIS